MGLDINCLNLDIIGSAPIEKDNLEHWQKAAIIERMAYESFKRNGCSRVQIDGVRYSLTKIEPLDLSPLTKRTLQDECLICGKSVNPVTDDEKLEFGLFGVHLACRENMSESEVAKFISDYEKDLL